MPAKTLWSENGSVSHRRSQSMQPDPTTECECRQSAASKTAILHPEQSAEAIRSIDPEGCHAIAKRLRLMPNAAIASRLVGRQARAGTNSGAGCPGSRAMNTAAHRTDQSGNREPMEGFSESHAHFCSCRDGSEACLLVHFVAKRIDDLIERQASTTPKSSAASDFF